MPKFSERNGYTPARKLQIESMDDDLRTALWNVSTEEVWSTDLRYIHLSEYEHKELYALFRRLWRCYFRRLIEEFAPEGMNIYDHIKDHFFNSEWYVPYNFIEAILEHDIHASPEKIEKLIKEYNDALDENMAGYRIIGRLVTPIIEPEQITAITQALDNEQGAARAHLRKAQDLLSKRPDPDYNNSIKESISAVESKIKQLLDDDVSLSEGLKQLIETYQLPPAFRKTFTALYGFASEQAGTRHGKLQPPNATLAEASFFLVSCSAFVSYLTGLKDQDGKD